jgi:6-phospho-beta-glucosidase
MKIAVVGGAGVRTPLLVGGLTASDLPIGEIALYDVDKDRLAIIGGLAGRMAAKGLITLSATLADCVADADFVFTSIRVGGLAQRIRDERIALQHGIVGQETVGPAGFAMAARTIPHMVQYAREIARVAPARPESSASAIRRPSCSRRWRARSSFPPIAAPSTISA